MSDNPEYFVMLLCPNGSYCPMEDNDGRMKFLNTEQEARQEAIWAYRVEQVPSLKRGWIDNIAHFVPNLWDHLTPIQLIQMINRTTDNPNETTES